MYICMLVRCKGMKYFRNNQIFHEIFSKKFLFTYEATRRRGYQKDIRQYKKYNNSGVIALITAKVK